jgi:WD40 repeat protein
VDVDWETQRAFSGADIDDKSIRVWCLKTGRCLHELRGHLDGVSSLHLDRGSSLRSLASLFSGDEDGHVKVCCCCCSYLFILLVCQEWNLQEQSSTVAVYGSDRRLCMHMHGNRFAVSGRSGSVAVWARRDCSSRFMFQRSQSFLSQPGHVQCLLFDAFRLVVGVRQETKKEQPADFLQVYDFSEGHRESGRGSAFWCPSDS